MITPTTSPQYALLRSDNQSARLALAIFRPNIIAQTTLTNAVQTNWPLSITVAGGTLTGVRRGTLIYVGTSAGASDVGRLVARGPASGLTIPIYPVTGITWYNGLHITITDEIELQGSRINTGSTSIVLDNGTMWTSNYRNMSPIPIMGGDVVVRVGEQFSKKSDAYHPLGAAISAYSWTSAGATITGGTTNNPTISFATRGNYRLSLAVTAGGMTSTGFRRVLAWDDESADIYPARLVGSVSASLYEGGHACRVKIAGSGVLFGGERVALFALAEYYGGAAAHMGQAKGSEKIILSGWVDNLVNYKDEFETWTEFELVGWQRKLQTRNAQYIVERVTGPESNYLQLKNPTLRSVLWHVCMVESNAGEVMDAWADNGLVMPTIEHSRAQLFAQLQDVSAIAAGTAGVDRWGRLFLSRDADLKNLASPIISIEAQDVSASYSETRENGIERAVTISAQSVSAFSAASNVYAISPGNSHNAADIVNIDGLAVSSQGELNTIAGRYYGRYNRPTTIMLTMQQNNRLVDLFPSQVVQWKNHNYVPNSLEWIYNNETGGVKLKMTALEINQSGLAETMIVPVTNDDNFSVSEINLPAIPEIPMPKVDINIPEFPMPPDPTKEIDQFAGSIFLLTSGGLYYALDLDNPIAPTYQLAGGPAGYSNMTHIALSNDTVYIAGQHHILAAKRDAMILDYKMTPGILLSKYGDSPLAPGYPLITIGSFGVNRASGDAVALIGRRFFGARGDIWINFEPFGELAQPSIEYFGIRGDFVENIGYVTSYFRNDSGMVISLGTGYAEVITKNTGFLGPTFLQKGLNGLTYYKDAYSRIYTSENCLDFTALNIFSSVPLGIAPGVIVYIQAQSRSLNKSTDGGNTSTPVATPTGFLPYNVFCADENNWIVSGILSTFGVTFIAVYKTDDGGVTWWPFYGALAEQTVNQTPIDMLVAPSPTPESET